MKQEVKRKIKRGKCKCWIRNWFLFDCASYNKQKKRKINKWKKDEIKEKIKKCIKLRKKLCCVINQCNKKYIKCFDAWIDEEKS